MRNDKDNLIVQLTLEFSLKIIEYSEELEELKKYVIARQLLKSGTSIGANVREAQNAESKANFVHKMKIAAKEADELRSNHEYLKNNQIMSKLNIGLLFANFQKIIPSQQD